MGVGRESNPHPHRSTLTRDFAQPHRPVTMAFREVFAKLLNEETDWSAPENKATAQAEADADDGQDPGKKLFWSTTHPDITGVPFTGWGDPNAEPDHPLVSPAACSTCRPDLEIFYYIIDDPAPSHENENVVAEAQSQLHDEQPAVRGAQGARQHGHRDRRRGDGRAMRDDHRQRRLPLPCKPNDPLCVDDPLPMVLDPTDPISPVTPPVIIIGGGGGSGPVGAIGGVPETSTWLMGIIGFGFLSLFRRSVMSTASGPTPGPTKARTGGPDHPRGEDPVPFLARIRDWALAWERLVSDSVEPALPKST